MVSKGEGGKLPVKLSLRFPSTICSGGIPPSPGVEALPDLRVILYRTQQLEHEVMRPSGFVSQQLLSHQGGETYFTETLFAWPPSVGSGSFRFFTFFVFVGATAVLVFLTGALAFPGPIVVMMLSLSVDGIKFVLFIFT